VVNKDQYDIIYNF